MGAERRSIVMPEEERRNTAYHESGHAIVARAAAQDRPGAQGHDHPARPRAGRDDAAAGAGPLQHGPQPHAEHDRRAVRRAHRRRALHEPDDHRRVERLRARDRDGAQHGHALRHVRRAGPDGLRRERGRGLPRPLDHDARRTCPRRRCARSTSEIRKIIDQQYAVARKLLEDNRDKVEAMAKALLELETIDADQIDDIMAGKPPRPPKPTQSGGGSSPPGATPAARTRRRRPIRPEEAMPQRNGRRAAARPVVLAPAPSRAGSMRAERASLRPAHARPRAPARDGHPQRHAGLVLRRRPLLRRRARARRTRGGWWPTAPT